MKSSRLTWKALDSMTGGLSKPSKMPCAGWSISASECRIGSILRGIEGSTCSGCYARKGRYVFPNVAAAHTRRLKAFLADPTEWAAAMVFSIRKKGESHFRWFDSGDLQSELMLGMICWIASKLPQVSFWLPTQERGIVSAYLASGNAIPSNLTIRVSAPMRGEAMPLPQRLSDAGLVRSAVADPHGRACPAPLQNGECGDCRACWNRSSDLVSYAQH